MADENQTQGTQTGGTTQSSQGQGNQSQSTKTGTDGASNSSQGTGGNTQTSQTQGQQRPEWAPESIWDAKTNAIDEAKAKQWREEADSALAFKGAKETERLTLPPNAEGYKATLPDDFKLPVGVEFSLDEKSPAMIQAKTVAHKHGLTQQAFSDLLGVQAAREAETVRIGKLAYTSEVAKLGANGPGRIDALGTWMKGTIGDMATQLTGVKDANGEVQGGVFWTAGIIEAFEAIQRKTVSQGASNYTGNGRDNGANDGKIPNYANMSFEQRRHAQEQRRNGAR